MKRKNRHSKHLKRIHYLRWCKSNETAIQITHYVITTEDAETECDISIMKSKKSPTECVLSTLIA